MSFSDDLANLPVVPSAPLKDTGEVAPYLRRKLWTPVVLLAMYWLAFGLVGLVNMSMFPRFLVRAGALMVLLLGFFGWWLVRGSVRVSYRFALVAWFFISAIGVMVLYHSTAHFAVIVLALPVLLTAWILALVVLRGATERARLATMMVIAVLVWIPGMFVRIEGLKGDGGFDYHLRQQPSDEELFLAQSTSAGVAIASVESDSEPLVATAEDWVGFRGANRDASVSAVPTVSDWDQNPPREVWRTRVGPAWSSMVIVSGRLFTQEQRGQIEVVSCFDANTGKPMWAYEVPGRYEEPLGGVGPRATPVFANGRIYALGPAGKLHCVNASNGKKVWSRDIMADVSATLPSWGFSGSPLVVDKRVFVFAGGKAEQALIALDSASGDILWKSPAGVESYSSPQWAVIAGQPQVLFIGEKYLGAYDLETGKLLWKYDNAINFGRPVAQPRLVGDGQLLVSFAPDQGLTRVDVTRKENVWSVEEKWTTRDIKPDFSDFVHQEGYLYGFDGNIFCCLDLATGKRQWKGGRYGAGQVVLLADQPRMIVITEQGELVLVAANPRKPEELARFPALEGKTWNHPAISHGKLYVRNASEMACFDLQRVK